MGGLLDYLSGMFGGGQSQPAPFSTDAVAGTGQNQPGVEGGNIGPNAPIVQQIPNQSGALQGNQGQVQQDNKAPGMSDPNSSAAANAIAGIKAAGGGAAGTAAKAMGL